MEKEGGFSVEAEGILTPRPTDLECSGFFGGGGVVG